MPPLDLEDIIRLTDQIDDPLERVIERQRLTRELYAEQAAAAPPKSEEDEYSDTAEALAALADTGLELRAAALRRLTKATPGLAEDAASIADTLEQVSKIGPQGDTAEIMRQNARILRERYAPPPAASAKPVPRPVRRSLPRARARREHRVAQATSSASSGEPHEPEPDSDRARNVIAGWLGMDIPSPAPPRETETDRCMCCDTVGRLIDVGSAYYSAPGKRATVQCTVCYCTFEIAEQTFPWGDWR